MKRHAWLFALLMLLALPAAAQATRGYASTGLNLRSGPDIGYPVVDFIPAGVQLYVHGCTFDWSWCDVSVFGERGWVAGDFIDYPYQRRWVSAYNYGAVIGIPIVQFVIGDYWYSHYRHRRFYRDRDYWYRHRFAYHAVPRYRHDGYRHHRWRDADGDRWRYRHSGRRDGGYRHDGGYSRRDDHDRRDGGNRFTGHRDYTRHARTHGYRYDRPKQRLAPSVRRAAMPRDNRARLAAPQRSQPTFGRTGGGHRMQPRNVQPQRSTSRSSGNSQRHRGGKHEESRRDVRHPDSKH